MKLRHSICVLAALIALGYASHAQVGPGTSSGGGGGGGAITAAAGSYAAGAFSIGAGVDGWDLGVQATTAAASCASGAGENPCLKQIDADIKGSIPAGTNIIGKIGIDQTTPGTTNAVQISGPLGAGTAPAAAASVAFPDEVNACSAQSLACSVTSAATLGVVDMTGYASLTLCVTANASANTISFTDSDDNVNFIAVNILGLALTTNVGAISTNTTSACFRYAKKKRYFKAAVTTFVSGTTTVTLQLHQNTPNDYIFSPALAAGTAAVGKIGPGFTANQTPVSVSVTGTTAATTATMAAVSGKTNWMCGFSIRANATAAANVQATVTGILGGTMTFQEWVAPLASGIGVVEPPLGHVCISASTTNTAISVVSGAAGTGGNTTVNVWGYVE